MKDSEFIELLNLYLDHEISAADAARLESEVSSNPERHRVYQDYCRMQKACRMLAQDFVTESAPARAEVIPFSATVRPRRVGYYVAGGLAAAAACVTLIFVNGESTGAPAKPGSAVVAKQPVAPTTRTIGRTVSVPAPEDRAVLVNALALGGVSNTDGTKTSPLFLRDDAPQFDWIRTLEVVPMQHVRTEQFQFTAETTARPQTDAPDRGPLPEQLPMSAFQFRR